MSINFVYFIIMLTMFKYCYQKMGDDASVFIDVILDDVGEEDVTEVGVAVVVEPDEQRGTAAQQNRNMEK